MKVEPQSETEMPVQVEKPVAVHEQKLANQPGKPARRWWIAVLAFVIVAAVVISGILPRINARAALEKETAEMAIPTVSVITPKRGAPTQEVVLPANVQAYIDSPIYARTNGYLKRWYTDIGARVKSGQLIRRSRPRKLTSNSGSRKLIWLPQKRTSTLPRSPPPVISIC